jgi:pyrimidine-nucleoside phosphorylase
LKLDVFKRQLAEIGLVLAGQTADLAPADGKLYALRDVTATVANSSLIAASIMSKKLAAGADGIVLDVKTGSGAFMPTVEAAEKLARIMVGIGIDVGRRMVALISDMNQPLGHAIGNALEVKEAIAALQGEGPADFWTHCREVAGQMLVVAGKAKSLEAAYEMVERVRKDGRGLEKFRAMVAAQGGDLRQIDDPGLLPQASLVEPLVAPRSGTIAAMDTGSIGWACVHLGGGRFVKTDKLDHAVGFVLPVKIGDSVQKGEEFGQIHANDATRLAEARERVLAALSWSEGPVEARPLFYGTIHEGVKG